MQMVGWLAQSMCYHINNKLTINKIFAVIQTIDNWHSIQRSIIGMPYHSEFTVELLASQGFLFQPFSTTTLLINSMTDVDPVS